MFKLCGRWSDNPGLCCLAAKELNLTQCLPQIGISSCEDLIRDKELQVLIWIVAAACLLFNVFVVGWRIMEGKVLVV